MSFAEDIAAATKVAICGWLANGGNAATAYWIVRGSRTPWTAVAGGAAALGLLALNYGCNYNPDAGSDSDFDGCRRADPGGAVQMYWYLNGTRIGQLAPQAEEIVSFRWEPFGSGFRWWLTQRELDGVTRDYTFSQPADQGGTPSFSSELVSGTCADQSPGPPGLPPDVTYTSPTTNCVYVISHQAYVLDETDRVTPVLKISPGISNRTSGGVIGGCNFDPVVVFPPGGDGGGGDRVYPWKDEPDGPDGLPWWFPLVKAALSGATAAAVSKALDELFKTPYPGGSYVLRGVCERDGDGNPMAVTRSSTYRSAPGIDAVLTRLDALADLFQYHKELRQPICRHTLPGGDLVTVNFVSDERSPQGEKPLRKYLRYRDQANRDLLVHGAHWRDFSWQAGPVCVCHKNGPWGVLQVWAISAGEGQRVIRHAGAVAGVDPDSDGEWLVTGSSDPRYGQPGTMRVERRVGGPLRQEFLRVTKRSDPNGLPLLPAA